MRNACVTHAQCLPGLCNLFNGRTRAGIIQHGACALCAPCERKANLEREQACRGAAPPRIAPSALVGSRPRFCCPSEVGGPEARHSPPALARQPPQGQVARQPVHGDPFPCHGPHPAHAYATLQRLDQGRATCPAGKPARRGRGAAVHRRPLRVARRMRESLHSAPGKGTPERAQNEQNHRLAAISKRQGEGGGMHQRCGKNPRWQLAA